MFRNGAAVVPVAVADASIHPFSIDGPESSAGFLLTDLTLRLIYADDAAVSILQYDSDPTAPLAAAMQQRLRTILQTERMTGPLPSTIFVSGRRRYVCRPSLVESRDNRARPPMVAVVLERQRHGLVDLSEMNRRFRLSPRESETVHHLIEGLTTKEVADRMSVSPNTVKQFVRLIMTKMGVTTRSGIVGKIVRG